jgi:hypothetical protein
MVFVREFKNAVDAETCNSIIKTFNSQLELGCSIKRHDTIRRDTQQQFNSIDESNFRNSDLASDFFKVIQKCVDEYLKDLGLDKVLTDGVWFKDMLVQRSEADKFESYSTWHCEVSHKDYSDRAFAYILYLNDDFEGGETQFMYQKHNQIPLKGSVVLFPAGFTHVHRGNMVTKGTKYIVTGWCFY